MSTVEVAALLGIHPKNVRRRAAAGVFPGAIRRPTVHGGWYIPKEAVYRYLSAA